jgi:GPH family glycoside/pentoside/hexuronide:cation symporter
VTPLRDEARVPARTLALYGLPVIATEAMFSLVIFWQLKFATDVLGISPAAMGALFGAARIADALVDPLAGLASDRTRSRFGRRRPWILLAALPMGLAYAASWSPPRALEGGALVLWMSVTVVAFYAAQSAFAIPHASLGAELTTSHHGRTRVFGVRAAFSGAGMLLGLAALAALERATDARASATSIATALGLLAAGTAAICALGVRERAPLAGQSPAPFRAATDVVRNPHARRLLGVFFCAELSTALLATMLPYAAQYLLHDPTATTRTLLCFLVATLISLPVWVALARRLGKRRAWLLSSSACTVGFASIWFVQPGDGLLLAGIAAAIGLAHGAVRVLPLSIQADVMDWDELRTGERKEGTYVAAWNLAAKAAAGIGVACCGALLAGAGFVPGAPASAETQTAMRLAGSLLPAAAYGIATWLLAGFALDEAAHHRIRSAIEERATSQRSPEAVAPSLRPLSV